MRAFWRAVRNIIASTGHDLSAAHPVEMGCCPLNPYRAAQLAPARVSLTCHSGRGCGVK